ncbi:MAG TPA: gluconate 2-dehydrogenase subunit 3 family protein [Thermoleophilaceae bacterium]|nr:gluconate 2-dehydrogenase subunit 3 family protein [Thermoleophilaceae bacterium]
MADTDDHIRDRGVTRRVVLRDGTALTLAVLAAGAAGPFGGGVAVAVTPGRAQFLTQPELNTLRGLVDVFIPGKPLDTDHGALAAGCAEAIDALLGAFRTKPPRIFAGAPFSDRAGSPVNHFEDFLTLDKYERRGWRLRIEGSRGRKSLEFNGPVVGWQQIYREGLAALDEAAGDRRFADLTLAERDLLVRQNSDGPAGDLIDVAWPHTYQFMYGAPEYGGNRSLVGWGYTRWDGDVHPRGYTRAEVEEPLPEQEHLSPGEEALLAELLPLAPLASPEFAHNVVASSGGSQRALRAQLGLLVEGGLDLGGRDGA